MPANPTRSLAACLRKCRQLGVPPTRCILVVHAADQIVSLFAKVPRPASRRSEPATSRSPNGYCFVYRFPCSTSRSGVGQLADSNCTPLGLHRIAEKIGGGWPVGAVFKGRKVIGYTWKGLPLAKITSRILWLDGLEPGFNRGGNVDSHARYIYIHGTGDEPTIGRPASPGCIHFADDDLIPLFDHLPSGTLVWIEG